MTRAKIPDQGRETEELLAEMASFEEGDANWRSGRTWSLVYHAGEEHSALLKRAHALYASTNALNPIAFKSLKRMESEVVEMSAELMNGAPGVVGTMSSGGTESILLACMAARERAGVRRPEIVAPKTIHVAFEKAAHYFGIKLRLAPIGRDMRADVRAMKRLMNRNTVLVAASAPQYPHGVIDPIEDLAAIAKKRGIPFHTDACVGGFMLPWIEKLGNDVPKWDFRVPGVTSISADIHKYGYAAKGASVVLYRDMSYLRHQFFVSTNWPGGIYASPSMAGTRPGGAISAAWAAMMSMGEDGYMELASKALEATKRLRAGIDAIPGLRVLGDPPLTILAYASADPDVDIYAVADQLEASGWSFDRDQNPAAIHCTVNANQLEFVDEYLTDVRCAVAEVKAHPELIGQGSAPMYGMMARLPLRSVVRKSVLDVMEGLYGSKGSIDLNDLGAGEDSGLLMRAARRYGGRVLGLLNHLDARRRR
ncbi:MAG: aspartate aminotransferase family protein [Planctomycetes bacterium]|nr:aspartate aminotransferase family protein [Planctomycetota bacterium]